MKIGILTFHEADNCGAVLQAYALTETVKSINENAVVEIINYDMPYITRQYRYFALDTSSLKSFVISLVSRLFQIRRKLASRPKYRKFRDEFLNISNSNYKNPDDITGHDVYIVGSDQVWNYDITGGDPVFFLDFADEKSIKISYAASIAKDNIGKSELNDIVNKLRNLDAVSVRETAAYDMLKQMTTQKIHQVLDPTLVADKSIWKSLVGKHANDVPYLLVYMVSFNGEVLKTADKLSKRLGLPVWCITTSPRTNGYKFKFIKDVGPTQFVNLLSKAEFIITNSFHGTAFSVIFNKNFITIPHKVTSTRMVDLLHLLGLGERIVYENSELTGDYNLEIDYTTTNDLLDIQKEKSLEFLKNSLGLSNGRD